MTFQQIRPVFYTVFHHIDIGFIQSARPNIIFIGQTGQKVSGSGTAIPYIILILPIFAQNIFQIFLTKLHPLLRRKKRTFALAHILRNQQVASFYNIVPKLFARRTIINTPKPPIRALPIIKHYLCGILQTQLVFILTVHQI